MATIDAMRASLESLRLRNELAQQRLRARAIRAAHKAVRAVGNLPAPSARYESAVRTRVRPGPRPAGGSPQKHLTAFTRGQLRRDCQDLERNSTYGRIVIRRAEQIIIGDGPIVASTSAAGKEWNDECDRLWRLFDEALDPDLVGHPHLARQLSFPQVLAGLIAAACTDGDQLLIRTNRGSLQVVESERVISPGGPHAAPRDLPGGGRLIDGVETGPDGAPRCYHVADWDARGNLTTTTRRVPAADAWLFVNPMGAKASLLRGEPALQAVLERIERMDSFDLSHAVAAEVATRFAAIVMSSDPAGLQALMQEATANQPNHENPAAPRDIAIESGVIQHIGRGDKVEQLKPEAPNTNYREYVLWNLMVIGAELGVPVVASVYDASGLSWSNIKALLSLSMRSIEPSQNVIARLVRWVREWKVREWIQAGLLAPVDDYDACDVVLPRAPVVDFKSEVEGYEAACRFNLMTKDMATQALGHGRFSDIAAKRAEERRLEASLGISPADLPGAKAGDGGTDATNADAKDTADAA